MKKIPVLILIMLCANLAFGQAPTLSMPKGLTGTAGSTITVPVSVTNVTGKEYYSFRVAVTYDTTVLRATGYSLTGAIIPSSGWTIIENKNDNSVVPGAVNADVRPYILVGATGGGALRGAGTLLSITFQVKVSTPAGKVWPSAVAVTPSPERAYTSISAGMMYWPAPSISSVPCGITKAVRGPVPTIRVPEMRTIELETGGPPEPSMRTAPTIALTLDSSEGLQPKPERISRRTN